MRQSRVFPEKFKSAHDRGAANFLSSSLRYFLMEVLLGVEYLAEYGSLTHGHSIFVRAELYQLPHFVIRDFVKHPKLQLRCEDEYAFVVLSRSPSPCSLIHGQLEVFEYIAKEQRVDEDLEGLVRLVDFNRLSPFYLIEVMPLFFETHKSLFKGTPSSESFLPSFLIEILAEFLEECKLRLEIARTASFTIHLSSRPDWAQAIIQR